MNAEDQENGKWNIIFEYQSIRNKHESEYWKIVVENQKIQKMISLCMLLDFLFSLLVCIYICFFC